MPAAATCRPRRATCRPSYMPAAQHAARAARSPRVACSGFITLLCAWSPLYFRWHRSRYLTYLHIYILSSGVYYNILSTSESYYNIEFVFVKCNVLCRRMPAVLVILVPGARPWASPSREISHSYSYHRLIH